MNPTKVSAMIAESTIHSARKINNAFLVAMFKAGIKHEDVVKIFKELPTSIYFEGNLPEPFFSTFINLQEGKL